MPPHSHGVTVRYRLQCYPLGLSAAGRGDLLTATPRARGQDFSRTTIEWDTSGHAIALIDLDDDGDLDVVGSVKNGNTDELKWWSNLSGDGSTWAEGLIEMYFERPSEFIGADLDEDGDTDLVAAGLGDFASEVGQLAWFENRDGQGRNWHRHEIGDLEVWNTASVADIDGDGDLDVVAGIAYNDRPLVWWENATGPNEPWVEHVIDEEAEPVDVIALDVDMDGDTDVLTASGNAPHVLWWENLDGSGTSWSANGIDDEIGYPNAIDIADFDGDGRLDVVARDFHEIAWWRSSDTHPWSKTTVTEFPWTQGDLSVGDFDGDGSPDIATVDYDDEALSWWENRADGSAWRKTVVDVDLEDLAALDAGDVDGDAVADLLTGRLEPDPYYVSGPRKLDLWRNTLSSHCEPGTFRWEDIIDLAAAPSPGWGVSSWSGTLDDETTAWNNQVEMPPFPHEASVEYSEGCRSLSLTVAGAGLRPAVFPQASDGCPGRTFVSGEAIELTGRPAPGFTVTGWTGTDSPQADSTSQLTMPEADHRVGVRYEAIHR